MICFMIKTIHMKRDMKLAQIFFNGQYTKIFDCDWPESSFPIAVSKVHIDL